MDCSDTDPSRNPGTYELCDPSNVDQDCDSAAFDGCPSSLTLGATTWLTTIGDPNFNFFDGCGGAGPTAVIVGFNVAAGTLVDSVQAVCKTTQLAQSSGSPEYQYSVQTTGAEVLTGRFGGGGGTTVALRCNPNEVVVTVDAFADSNQIYRFGIWCAPITFVRSGSSWVATTGTPRAGGAWGNASGPYVSYQCPDGGAVNNMLGTAGAYLNGFQSICQQMSYVPR